MRGAQCSICQGSLFEAVILGWKHFDLLEEIDHDPVPVHVVDKSVRR